MKKKLLYCSSSFALLRTPVKKPERSKIQNFLMNKIPNSVMNYQRNTKVIVKKQNMTGYDSGCGYDGVGKFRDPELRKDGQPSTKVVLVSLGACDTFPPSRSRFQTLTCCTESEDCHGVRIQMKLIQQEPVHSLFPFSSDSRDCAHCRQQCSSCTPCQECKAKQHHQILFCGVTTPSLTPARPSR